MAACKVQSDSVALSVFEYFTWDGLCHYIVVFLTVYFKLAGPPHA